MLNEIELKRVEEEKKKVANTIQKINEKEKDEMIEYLGKIFYAIDEKAKRSVGKKWSLKFFVNPFGKSKRIIKEYKENTEAYLKSNFPDSARFKIKVKKHYGDAMSSDSLLFKIKRVA